MHFQDLVVTEEITYRQIRVAIIAQQRIFAVGNTGFGELSDFAKSDSFDR